MLFSGDVVMNQSFVAASAVSSMKAWMAAFDRFDALKPATIVPAHGAVGTGGLVDANRTFMGEIDTRARALKVQGRSIDEVAKIVSSEQIARHPDWPRANGVAAAARASFNEAP